MLRVFHRTDEYIWVYDTDDLSLEKYSIRYFDGMVSKYDLKFEGAMDGSDWDTLREFSIPRRFAYLRGEGRSVSVWFDNKFYNKLQMYNSIGHKEVSWLDCVFISRLSGRLTVAKTYSEGIRTCEIYTRKADIRDISWEHFRNEVLFC